MHDIKLGQFVLGNSYLHRLDPRTKIICSMLIIFSVLFDARWFLLLFSLLILMAAIVLSRLKLKKIMRGMRKLSLMLLLTFILQLLLAKGTPLFQAGFISITKEGIELSVTTMLRLLLLYLSSSLLTMTTSPVSLATGIEALLAPLSRLKVPVHQLAMVIGTSFRFVPTILEEAETITKAQQSRGAPFSSPNPVTRIKSRTAVLIPLLAASLQRADDLAMAMESRCYAGKPNQFRLRNLAFGKRDILAVAVVGLVLILPFFI